MHDARTFAGRPARRSSIVASRLERTRAGSTTSAAQSSANDASAAGALHVVATPIGNLGDLTPRAREVLAGAALVLAEDTRRTAQLFSACGISAPLASVHEHNEAARVPEILERLGRGEQLALVSDAGTPLVSDPGYRIVRAAAQAGFRVLAVPGACAAVAALSIAGLASDRFLFEGFLPAKDAARRTRLRELAIQQQTLIFYEAPQRLARTLEDLAAAFTPAREALVARELTKLFETAYRGTLAELARRAGQDADMQRGEIVIVVAGAAEREPDDGEARRVLEILLRELPVRQAADLAAQLTGTAPNQAYKLALQLSGQR